MTWTWVKTHKTASLTAFMVVGALAAITILTIGPAFSAIVYYVPPCSIHFTDWTWTGDRSSYYMAFNPYPLFCFLAYTVVVAAVPDKLFARPWDVGRLYVFAMANDSAVKARVPEDSAV